MLFRQSEKKNSDEVLRKLPSRGQRLHSVAAVLRGRTFQGSFQVGGSSYELTYTPAKAFVVGRRLQLQGRLTVKELRGEFKPSESGTLLAIMIPSTRERVRATVVGTQGGISAAPPRRQEHTSAVTATPQLPEVESTGATSFCGVVYIHFEPLAGSAFGVAADLGRLQLNARFAPVNDAERALQGAYSWIVDALYGKQADVSSAAVATSELNKLLAES
ncbi:MAG: hypothetical protein AABO57_13365 [Acidobacteriota bacterium]